MPDYIKKGLAHMLIRPRVSIVWKKQAQSLDHMLIADHFYEVFNRRSPKAKRFKTKKWDRISESIDRCRGWSYLKSQNNLIS